MKKLLLGAIAILAMASIALGAGYFPGFPIVGQGANQQCVNMVNGSCVQYAPAGPSGLAGTEMIPADTENQQGINPGTVLIPSSLMLHSMDRNRLIGGDFTTNLWQRGSTPVSNATPTVALMTADRWWVISPSGTVDVLKTTPASTAADYLGGSGLYNGLELRRHTGSTGALACVGQTLDQNAAAQLIGQNAVFSFTGYAPSTYSAAGGNVTVSVAYFTATDTVATQAAIGDAGGNGSKAALVAAGQSGGPTNYTAAVNVVNAAGGSVASGVATIPLTTTPTRVSVSAPIPTNVSGTAVTGVSVSICGTFVATTSVTTDWFEIFGAQLESKPGTVTATNPLGVTSPTGLERRNAQEEAMYQLAYSYIITESASAKTIRGLCTTSTTSLSNCLLNFPVPMRVAPASAFTAGFTACTTVACTTAGGMTTCTGNAIATSIAAATPNNLALVTCVGATQPAAGSSSFMADLGTGSSTGVMQFSAEP